MSCLEYRFRIGINLIETIQFTPTLQRKRLQNPNISNLSSKIGLDQ